MEEIHWEEVDALLSFLAAASDSHIVSSILAFLLDNSSYLYMHSARGDSSISVQPSDQLPVSVCPRGVAMGEGNSPTGARARTEHVCQATGHQGASITFAVDHVT